MPSIADLRNSIPGLDTFTDLEVADIYARGAGVAPDLARYELGLAQPKRNTGLMGDLGTALKTGVQKLPGTAAALVDLPFAATTGATPASDVWGAIDRNTVNLDRRARDARFEYSPSYERDQQAVQQVWNENIDDKDTFTKQALSVIRASPELAAAYAKHPAYTLNQVVNSLPGMVAGGFAGRALMGIGGRAAAGLGEAAGGMGPVRAAIPGALERGLGAEWGGSVAAGLGEGAVAGAGNFQQSMEENRNNPNFDTMRSARMNLAGGAVTSLIGIGAGRAAKAMGLETAETAIVAGRMGGADRAMWKNVLGGAASESVLQEFPQSLSEAGFQNLGEGRDFNDSGSGPSILRQGIEGAAAGGIMGGVANIRGRQRPPPPAAPPTPYHDGSTDLLRLPPPNPIAGGNGFTPSEDEARKIDAAVARNEAMWAARDAEERRRNNPAAAPNPARDGAQQDFFGGGGLQRDPEQLPLFDASNEGFGRGGQQQQLPFDQMNMNLRPGETQDMFSGEMSPGTRQPVDLGPTASEFSRALTVGNLDLAHKIGAEAAHALGPKVYAEYESLVEQVRQRVTPPVDENGQPDMFRGGQSMPPALVQRLQQIVETGGELVDERRSTAVLRKEQEAQRPIGEAARKGLITKAMGGAANVSRIKQLNDEITTSLEQSNLKLAELRKKKKGGIAAHHVAAQAEVDAIKAQVKDALAKRNLNKLLDLSKQARLIDTETGAELAGEIDPEHVKTISADLASQEAGVSAGTKKEQYLRRVSALWRGGHVSDDEAGTMMNYVHKNDEKSRAAVDYLLKEKEKEIAEAATEREAKHRSAVFGREEDELMQTTHVVGPEWVKIQAERVVAAANLRKANPDSKARSSSDKAPGEQLDIVKQLIKDGARNSDLHVWWALAKLVNLARHDYPDRAEQLKRDMDPKAGLIDKPSTADLGSRIIKQMIKTGAVRPFDLQKAKQLSNEMDRDPNPTVDGLSQGTSALVADFVARMPIQGGVSGKTLTARGGGETFKFSLRGAEDTESDWHILNSAATRLGYKSLTEGARNAKEGEKNQRMIRPAAEFMLADILFALEAYKHHQNVGKKKEAEMVDLLDELDKKFGRKVMEVVTRYGTQGRLDKLARVRFDRPDFFLKDINPDRALITRRIAGLLALLQRADEHVNNGDTNPVALKNQSNYQMLMAAWDAYRKTGVNDEGELAGRRLLPMPRFIEVLLTADDAKIKALYDKTLDAQKGWGTRAAAWRRDLNTVEIRYKDQKTDRIMTRFELNPARAHVQQIRVLAGLKEEKVKNAREAAELEAAKLKRAQPMKSQPMSIMPIKPDKPETYDQKMERLTEVNPSELDQEKKRAREEADVLNEAIKKKEERDAMRLPARELERTQKFLNDRFAWFGAGHLPSFNDSIGRGEARVRLQAIAGKLGIKKSGSVEELAARVRDRLEVDGTNVINREQEPARDEAGVKIHQPGEDNESQNIGKDAANQKATGKPISEAALASQERELRSDSESRDADIAAEIERLAPLVAQAKGALRNPERAGRTKLRTLISALAENIPLSDIPHGDVKQLAARLERLVNAVAELAAPVIDKKTGEEHMPLPVQEQTRFSKTQIAKPGGQGQRARGRATRKLIPQGEVGSPAAKVNLEAAKQRAQNALNNAFTTDEILKLADHFGTDPATAAQKFMQTYASWVRSGKRVSDNLVDISGLLQKYSQAAAKKELTPSAVPARLNVTLKVKVEDTGEVHEVEFNARKALLAASQKVKRLEALADCL